MTLLPHMAARLFGAPLLIHRPKLEVILAVLGPRIGVGVGVGVIDLAAPTGYTAPEHTPARSYPKIAVIPIHGTLVRRTVGLEAESGLSSYTAIAEQLDAALAQPDSGLSSYTAIAEQQDAALAQPDIAAILLDIDSPGGESGGVFDLADRIRTANAVKPVWAVANEMAFSAAYALASAAGKVFVSRTGGVGSIGVIAMHVDQSVKDAKDGVRYTTVFAGNRKNDLNPHQPISDEAHALLQTEVDRVYGLFVETVARHRGLERDAVVATQAGLFFGQDAVTAGLADVLGTFDDAILQLTELVSPQPMPTTVQRRPSLNLNTEHPMNECHEPVTDQLDADDQHPPIPATTKTLSSNFSLDDAIEIAQTCTLAGRADLIAGLLQSKTSPAKVRSQLLAAQADGSPEIASRIAPDASVSMTSSSNLMVDAAKQLAAKSASLRKEI